MKMTRAKKARGSIMLHLALAVVLLGVFAGTAAEEKAGSNEVAITLGAPFCENMVLQREMKVPVWGWTKPGDTITVEFAGQKVTGKTDSSGKFMVWLKPLDASFAPRVMTITASIGNRQSSISNVLVGEVWLASGQSNMQQAADGWPTTSRLARELAAETKDKVVPIREFEVTSVTAQLHPIEHATGAWKDGDYAGYSAIALAFAEKLYRELNVPVGILNCSWSETAIEAWIPRVGYATAEDDYGKALHQKCLMTDPRTPEHKAAWTLFFQTLDDQIAESEERVKQGNPANEIEVTVPGNMNGNRDATWLFNGRLNPVVPYALRGAIWNQGWANRAQGLAYYNNLHNMIRGWRLVWDKPELPVYFHQFYCPDQTDKPGIDSTAEMRQATWMARDIPHADMASQIDIGGKIHYDHKTVPGRRLALLALKNQYGKEVVAHGPMFRGYEVKGDKVVVTFEHADGGLVVADTVFNRTSRDKEATGFADPKIIENGEEKVTLFWLAGEDKVWHPATFKIEGDKVVVQSDAVKQPRGISYGSGGIGFQPCLYNKALLPMTPFIQYEHEMVTTRSWPGGELKLAGADDVKTSSVTAGSADKANADEEDESASADAVDLVYEYRKMPLLSTPFRDNAVFQADQPVTIWGSTRQYGEFSPGLVSAGHQVHVEFGPENGTPTVQKVIDVTPEMQEWQVKLPAMEAGPKPYRLKVWFTIDGKPIHERNLTGIVFGDVWYVGAPGLPDKMTWKMPEVKPSGQIVRMMENESKTSEFDRLSRYSVAVSTKPTVRLPNGRMSNRYGSYWKDASGLAAAMGHTLAAKSGRPVGIVFMQTTGPVPIRNWMAWQYLKDAPSLMDEFRRVGSQYPESPYYVDNARRYLAEWKAYWSEYIPAMIATRAVPDGAQWGWMPALIPDLAGSTAAFTYNRMVYSFTPMTLRGIIFLAGEGMVTDEQGANFGPEMAALANCFKTRFDSGDVPFIYTVPDKKLAPKISVPAIKGESTAVTVDDWLNVSGVFDALAK